jgi:hypothetical protein
MLRAITVDATSRACTPIRYTSIFAYSSFPPTPSTKPPSTLLLIHCLYRITIPPNRAVSFISYRAAPSLHFISPNRIVTFRSRPTTFVSLLKATPHCRRISPSRASICVSPRRIAQARFLLAAQNRATSIVSSPQVAMLLFPFRSATPSRDITFVSPHPSAPQLSSRLISPGRVDTFVLPSHLSNRTIVAFFSRRTVATACQLFVSSSRQAAPSLSSHSPNFTVSFLFPHQVAPQIIISSPQVALSPLVAPSHSALTFISSALTFISSALIFISSHQNCTIICVSPVVAIVSPYQTVPQLSSLSPRIALLRFLSLRQNCNIICISRRRIRVATFLYHRAKLRHYFRVTIKPFHKYRLPPLFFCSSRHATTALSFASHSPSNRVH